MTVTAPTKIFADRIGRIEVSATMAVAAEAAKLRAQGANLVDFGAGEPHFATPRHIKDAAIAAIEANFTRYTVVPGIPDVRKAIVDRHACDFGSDYTIDEAVFTSGGNAWAVGSFVSEFAGPGAGFALHWNGKSWSRVTSPGVLKGAGQLSAISVVSATDEHGLEKPKAFVVLKSKVDPAEFSAALKEHVKDKVGKWKYPRWIDVRPDLPRTATGKIQRFKLRELES